MSLACEVIIVGTGDIEATGPTLLLNTYKCQKYSDEKKSLESIWFNCGDCSTRSASESNVKSSLSTAALFTRMEPSRISGLSSLVFHLSETGTEALNIIGPNGVEEYVAGIKSFVYRRYPEIKIGRSDKGVVSDSDSSESSDSESSSISEDLNASSVESIENLTLVYSSVQSLRYSFTKETSGVRIYSINFADLDVSTQSMSAGMKRPRKSSSESLSSGKHIPPFSCYLVDVQNVRNPSNHSKITEVSGNNRIFILILDIPQSFANPLVSRRISESISSFSENIGLEVIPYVFHMSSPSILDSESYKSFYFEKCRSHFAFQSRFHLESSTESLHTHFPAATLQAVELNMLSKEIFPLYSVPIRTSDTVNSNLKFLRPLDRFYLFPQYLEKHLSNVSTHRFGSMVADYTPPPFIPAGQFMPVELCRYKKEASTGEVSMGLIREFLSSSIQPLTFYERAKPKEICQSNQSAAQAMREQLRKGSVVKKEEVSESRVELNLSAVSPFLTFLGTGSAAPSKLRSCSAIMLSLGSRVRQNQKSSIEIVKNVVKPKISPWILLDCGEGTATKLLQSLPSVIENYADILAYHSSDNQLSSSRNDISLGFQEYVKSSNLPVPTPCQSILYSFLFLRQIWISHMHADHHSGLLRVLEYRSMAVKDYIDCLLALVSSCEDIENKREVNRESVLNCIPTLFIVGPKYLQDLISLYRKIISDIHGYDYIKVSFVLSQGPLVEGSVSFAMKTPVSTFSESSCFPVVRRYSFFESFLETDGFLSITNWKDVPVLHSKDAAACVFSLTTAEGDSHLNNDGILDSVSRSHVIFAYSGDTRPTNTIEDAILEVVSTVVETDRIRKNSSSIYTILTHEATFNDDRLGDAEKKRHSTVGEAIGVGKSIEVALSSLRKKEALRCCELSAIFLTHFSQRYPSTTVKDKKAAESIATHERNIVYSTDLMRLPLLPNEIPKVNMQSLQSGLNSVGAAHNSLKSLL